MALAVLGTAFTVLVSAHTSAIRMAAEARNRFEAVTLARDVLTRTELEGLPTFGKDSGDFGSDFPSFRWERDVAEVKDLPFIDLKEVTVRVLWPDGNRTRTIEIAFFYLKKDK